MGKGEIGGIQSVVYKQLDKRISSLFNQLEFPWESSKEGNFSAPLTSLVSLARIDPIEDRFL